MTKYVDKDLKVNFKNSIPICYSYSRNRKIGILGGSFNPAHFGHIHITNTALINLGLDEIWWLVAPQNRLKSSLDMENFDKRLGYARLITKNFSYINSFASAVYPGLQIIKGNLPIMAIYKISLEHVGGLISIGEKIGIKSTDKFGNKLKTDNLIDDVPDWFIFGWPEVHESLIKKINK